MNAQSHRDLDWQKAFEFLCELQQSTSRDFGPSKTSEANPLTDARALEHTRRVYYSRNPDGSDEDFTKLMDSLRAQYNQHLANSSSPFEDPGWFVLSQRCYSRVLETAKAAGLNISREPILGTLTTGRVNGLAVGVPDSETRLIFLERGLFDFANSLSKVLATVLTCKSVNKGDQLRFSTDLSEIDAAIEEHPEFTYRFLNTLVAYVVTGDPQNAERYVVSRNASTVQSILVDSLELFVIAHEVGHVALGHLDGPRARYAVACGVEADAIKTEWQQEFQADFLGMQLSVATMRRQYGFDVALSYWGIDLFFAGVDVVDRMVNVLVNGDHTASAVDSSHPPPTARQLVLRRLLLETADEEKQEAEGAIAMGSVIDHIINRLYQNCRAAILSMHRGGIRPAVWWGSR